MASVSLLVVLAALLLEASGRAVDLTRKTEAVFVSQQAADAVLRRQRRFNSGHLEEIQRGNLERECKEETCTPEEAREVFENHGEFMKFWASYVDGNQCESAPCQNDGTCEDGMSTYVCWCKPNFGGKNCEIEVDKQCLTNNGGCSHFCRMQKERPVCQCAAGYKLGPNKKSCEPTGPFSCGLVELTSTSNTRSIVNPRSSNSTHYPKSKSNSSNTLEDGFYDDNITDIYDYYEFAQADPAPPNASAVHKRSPRSDSGSHALKNSSETSNATGTEDKKDPSFWAFFPTIPTITEKDNTDQRIVGGDAASSGEIPWQVTLMAYSANYGKVMHFCGGSLLSELWVITAAHCLFRQNKRISNTDFFVRLGELDLNEEEGPERDYLVEQLHIHRSYNYMKSQYNHDIALLKLANPVELSHHRRPICLGPSQFTERVLMQSSSSLVSGWGALKFHGLKATKLQKLAMPFVDRKTCKESSRDHVTRFMFCAGFPSGDKDSCEGDSGGPHATNYKGTWFLTGIVSWGEECAREGKYGIYTQISKYYAWISNTTKIHVAN
ncbi:coagulation factor IXb [Betta splendens]|uniref:Coagulation factor IX n=1 Tax=Betta splendens TaxID=158456 RepID=A0A6P7P8G8_BETSP|nr:coagulation factor IXb [Betta splendens]